MRIVAYDFDGTLTHENGDGTFRSFNWAAFNQLRRYKRLGWRIYIVTARTNLSADHQLSEEYDFWDGFPLVYATIRSFRLPINGVLFTDGALKGPYLANLEGDLLVDDRVDQRSSAVIHGVRAQPPPRSHRATRCGFRAGQAGRFPADRQGSASPL